MKYRTAYRLFHGFLFMCCAAGVVACMAAFLWLGYDHGMEVPVDPEDFWQILAIMGYISIALFLVGIIGMMVITCWYGDSVAKLQNLREKALHEKMEKE